MSDQALATTEQPTRRQLARREAAAPLRITGKLKVACDAMVYEGKALDLAAKSAGMPTRRLRLALAKSHVIAYLKQQRDVLRSSMSGANILTLAEVRDQTSNQMARVQAVKALEQIGDDAAPGARGPSAGFVIMVVGEAHMTHMRENEARPLKDNDGGHDGA